MLYVSVPLDTLETNSPICRLASPQACSTTSVKEELIELDHYSYNSEGGGGKGKNRRKKKGK